MTEPTMLRHNKSLLALWPLRAGEGTPLLLLNGLGERSPASVPTSAQNWAGPVYALDVTGHGRSTHSMGGGYTAEQLLADVDAALAHLGRCTLWGRGLGAYLALLAAGARTSEVAGAIIDDGPGLIGGGVSPKNQAWVRPTPTEDGGPDAYVLLEMSQDPRPADYAMTLARIALMNSDNPNPLVVTARTRPPWVEALASDPGVSVVADVESALALLS